MFFVLTTRHARERFPSSRDSIPHVFGNEPGELVQVRFETPTHAALRIARRMILRST